jgi:hypothetical protein
VDFGDPGRSGEFQQVLSSFNPLQISGIEEEFTQKRKRQGLADGNNDQRF